MVDRKRKDNDQSLVQPRIQELATNAILARDKLEAVLATAKGEAIKDIVVQDTKAKVVKKVGRSSSSSQVKSLARNVTSFTGLRRLLPVVTALLMTASGIYIGYGIGSGYYPFDETILTTSPSTVLPPTMPLAPKLVPEPVVSSELPTVVISPPSEPVVESESESFPWSIIVYPAVAILAVGVVVLIVWAARDDEMGSSSE